MTVHRIVQRMRMWRLARLVVFAVFVVAAGTASVGPQTHMQFGHPAAAATASLTGDDGSTVPPATVTSTSADANRCPFGAFCIYTGPGFSGARFELFACQNYTLINFQGIDGSWDNNQTSGTQAKFKNGNLDVILTTRGAHSQLAHFDYTNIAQVRPC